MCMFKDILNALLFRDGDLLFQIVTVVLYCFQYRSKETVVSIYLFRFIQKYIAISNSLCSLVVSATVNLVTGRKFGPFEI